MTSTNKLLRRIERGWYQPTLINWLLIPISWLYCLLATLHRWYWSGFPKRPEKVGVPVVVVGNVTVGGTGKTPLVIALARQLKDGGYNPGIVSRGYGGSIADVPYQVGPDDGPDRVGDEAVVMRRRSGSPVAVGRDRVAAARLLMQTAGCDVILSDDGLQHRRLFHDVSIVVIDASRGFGNGWCLPAGPLRESLSVLQRVDIKVSNGHGMAADFAMKMEVVNLCSLDRITPDAPLSSLPAGEIHAVAGIGNPERFFQQLESTGLTLRRHPFPDHHGFKTADFAFAGDDSVILMTEKDAVKCENLTIPGQVYYLPVEAELDPAFYDRVTENLSSLTP